MRANQIYTAHVKILEHIEIKKIKNKQFHLFKIQAGISPFLNLFEKEE